MAAGADVMLAKDQNLYHDAAKALLIAVNVAMLHATRMMISGSGAGAA